MEKKTKQPFVDKPEDVEMQQRIQDRARYSLALWGMAFAKRSGRFINLVPNSKARYSEC